MCVCDDKEVLFCFIYKMASSRFAKVKDGDDERLKDAVTAETTKLLLFLLSFLIVVLLIHNSIDGRAI